MARSCPACDRPNADTAVKCLYCSAALDPVTAPGPATPPASTATPTERDRQLLILAPMSAPDETTVALFGEWTALSRYEARMWLQSRRPRLFRRIDGRGQAKRLSARLTSASVPHLLVAEKAVRDMPIVRLKRASWSERELGAESDGGAISLAYRDLLLVVRGEITRESHDERNVGTKNAASRTLTPSFLLHVYARESAFAFEIDPDHFRWPDGVSSPSALLNLERFIGELSERAPAAPTDRGFDEEVVVLSRAGAGADLTQMLSDRPGGARGTPYDNAEQFRFYARWRYQLERHLRGPERPG